MKSEEWGVRSGGRGVRWVGTAGRVGLEIEGKGRVSVGGGSQGES